MNLFSLTLTKYSILLLILAVSFLSHFRVLEYSVSVLISVGISFLYFFFGYQLVAKKSARITGDYFRVNYLPYIVICKKIIFVFLFLVLGGLLLAPETRVLVLVPLLFILAAGETFFFLVSVKKNCYAVLFYPEYLYFLMDREHKIFAKNVKHIEYRFENFYLVMTSGSTFKINPDYIAESAKPVFRIQFLKWAHENGVSFTVEAEQKLAINNG